MQGVSQARLNRARPRERRYGKRAASTSTCRRLGCAASVRTPKAIWRRSACGWRGDPEQVTIQESKGLFSRHAKTTGVVVQMDQNNYILEIANGR